MTKLRSLVFSVSLIAMATPLAQCSSFIPEDCEHLRTCVAGAGGSSSGSNSGSAGNAKSGSDAGGTGNAPSGADPGSAGDASTAGTPSTGGSSDGGAAGNSALAGEAGAAGLAVVPCEGACSGSTPVCNATSNTCVECLLKSDCRAPKPACNTAVNRCVECVSTGDCQAPTPACDATAGRCVECRASTDCRDSTKPLCDPTAQRCVTCLKQADCTNPSASACTAGACSACTTDAECSNITGKGVCDAGTCVQCTGKKFAACGQDTGTALVCDSLKHTCTALKQRSVSACTPCVSDAQCQLGQLCALEKLGAADVGYFCFWKKGDTTNNAPADCFANGRPYSGTTLNASSIDGTIADVCSLRTSTCVARNQFSLKDCKSAATGNDLLCGAAPPSDAKCDLVNLSTSFSCTMRCLSDLDCPVGIACNIGALQPFCDL